MATSVSSRSWDPSHRDLSPRPREEASARSQKERTEMAAAARVNDDCNLIEKHPYDRKEKMSRHRHDRPQKPRRRYLALASDGDGTLKRGKRLAQATIAALERLRSSCRKVILA